MRDWSAAVKVYSSCIMLVLVFLGFSSGLPFGVLAEPLSAWLAGAGVSKTSIGLFALVSLPYAIKFLWAPFMDRLPLPVLSNRLGRRRGWAVLTQAALFCTIIAMGLTNPATDLFLTAVFALGVAFFSASQDIVLDAYRVESLSEDELAAGSATFVFGWRLGQVGGGTAGLIFADLFPWAWVFTGMAVLVLIGLIIILISPEPPRPSAEEVSDAERATAARLSAKGGLNVRLANPLAAVHTATVRPLNDFMSKDAWLAIIALILLYKFGDAVLAVMKVPFFLEIGFTNTEIAGVVKIFGFNAIIAGGFLGGILLARTGIMWGLMITGILMAASNLVFVAQALAGNDLTMLAVTIAVENITTGMGTTAFVAYLASLCSVAYTATQYALLTSFMAFSRTVMSSGAGWLADQMDWVSFFILTTVAAVPGLLLLWWMMRRRSA